MTKTQEIFAADSQAAFDLGAPRQDAIAFPLTLAERYQPRHVQNFIGIDYPKQVMTSLLAKPRPCSLIFIGPPGSGKTTLAMAFAADLPGTLWHVSAQKCDVATLDNLNEQFAYYPPKGKFWICLVDECDQMTDKAQLQLLSKLDGTAKLKPVYGGGFEMGDPPPIIWIFTCNGRGPHETDPPANLLPRFLSRSMQLKFQAADPGQLQAYLEQIWKLEGGGDQLPDLAAMVRESCHNVRDALMKLELALMAPSPAVTPVTIPLPAKPVPGNLPSAVSEAVGNLSRVLGEREAVTLLQHAVRDCGQRLLVDGAIGKLTLRAVNQVPELKLLAALERRVTTRGNA